MGVWYVKATRESSINNLPECRLEMVTSHFGRFPDISIIFYQILVVYQSGIVNGNKKRVYDIISATSVGMRACLIPYEILKKSSGIKTCNLCLLFLKWLTKVFSHLFT